MLPHPPSPEGRRSGTSKIFKLQVFHINIKTLFIKESKSSFLRRYLRFNLLHNQFPLQGAEGVLIRKIFYSAPADQQ